MGFHGNPPPLAHPVHRMYAGRRLPIKPLKRGWEMGA
jgi:hypothetical protein